MYKTVCKYSFPSKKREIRNNIGLYYITHTNTHTHKIKHSLKENKQEIIFKMEEKEGWKNESGIKTNFFSAEYLNMVCSTQLPKPAVTLAPRNQTASSGLCRHLYSHVHTHLHTHTENVLSK